MQKFRHFWRKKISPEKVTYVLHQAIQLYIFCDSSSLDKFHFPHFKITQYIPVVNILKCILTSLLWPTRVRKQCCVSRSQNFTKLSFELMTKNHTHKFNLTLIMYYEISREWWWVNGLYTGLLMVPGAFSWVYLVGYNIDLDNTIHQINAFQWVRIKNRTMLSTG